MWLWHYLLECQLRNLWSKKIKLAFAKDHVQTNYKWSRDETNYNVIGSDGKWFVRQRTGEKLYVECMEKAVECWGGSVLVWGEWCRLLAAPPLLVFKVQSMKQCANEFFNSMPIHNSDLHSFSLRYSCMTMLPATLWKKLSRFWLITEFEYKYIVMFLNKFRIKL